MDASENGATAPEKHDDGESFTKVKSKKSQKRKLEPDGGTTMEVEQPNKRPHFPPISADKLRVFTMCFHFCLCDFTGKPQTRNRLKNACFAKALFL